MSTRPLQTKFALTLVDGSLAIMAFITKGFNPDGSVQFERAATDANLRGEFKKARLDVASYRPIIDADLPLRDYRNAWVDTGTNILYDMAKAREIQKARLRAARALLLAELDVAYQRADEDGDQPEKARIVAEKRRLRDITNDPRINAATTIEALAAITLDPPASATVKR